MDTTTINIDAYRNELAQKILQTDSIEILDKVNRLFRRSIKAATKTKENPAPYTMEEIKERAEQSRADIAAGRVSTWAMADKELKKELPWLK